MSDEPFFADSFPAIPMLKTVVQKKNRNLFEGLKQKESTSEMHRLQSAAGE